MRTISEATWLKQFDQLDQAGKILLYQSIGSVKQTPVFLRFLSKLFVSRIAQYDLQELPAKLDSFFSEGSTIDIAGLIKEFNKFYCDKSLFGSFSNVFISAYRRYFKAKAALLDKSQLNLILQTYNRFVKYFSEGAGNAAAHSTGFILLELVIKANNQYLTGFNASYEIALYIHERIGSRLTKKETEHKEFFKQMLDGALVYNLDKDKMEQELRSFLTIRLIDNEKFDMNLEK